MTATLTGRQRAVVRAILAHYRDHGVPPSYRDLMAALGIKSPNGVAAHVRALLAKGALVALGATVDARRYAVPRLAEVVRGTAAELLEGL